MNRYLVELWSHGKLFRTEVTANSIEDAEDVVAKNITFEYQIVNVLKR